MPKLRSLPKLKGSTRPKSGALLRPTSGSNIFAQKDTELAYVARILGGDGQAWRVAKRVRELQPQYTNGTIPELITYHWLEEQQIDFVYQATVFGGRAVRGGVLPDFVVIQGGVGAAWQIQGNYWHSKKFNQDESDETARVKLLGSTVGGARVQSVIFVWESRIYSDYPAVFEAAMTGLELGE